MQWNPDMTEAPRDGTRILVCAQNATEPCIADFRVYELLGGEHDRAEGFWATDIGWVYPSHWMPLPNPPVMTAREASPSREPEC